MNFAQPFSDATFVNAAVSVVFPWSMCPMVPTLTCGFDRSNFSFAIVCSSSWTFVSGRFTNRPTGLRPPLYPCDHFLADVLRGLLVAVEVHAVGGASLC